VWAWALCFFLVTASFLQKLLALLEITHLYALLPRSTDQSAIGFFYLSSVALLTIKEITTTAVLHYCWYCRVKNFQNNESDAVCCEFQCGKLRMASAGNTRFSKETTHNSITQARADIILLFI